MSDLESDRSETLAQDLMLGAKKIGEFLGVSERQVFYFAETKALPLFKIGGKVAGRKSSLAKYVERLEKSDGTE